MTRPVVPASVTVRIVLTLFLGGSGILAAQVPRVPPRLRGPAVAYFDALLGYRVPLQASGTFHGKLANRNVTSGTGDMFHFDLVYTLCVPIPDLVGGGCLYTHDYGNKFDWDFNAGGPVEYEFAIPFTVTFDFPRTVYPGQHIALRPAFSWGRAELKTTQQVAYSQTTSAWLDAPFDGLDEASIVFTQKAASADLHLRFPVLPALPSAPLDRENISIPPFNAGGGSFGGSYTKLGGTGSLPNSATEIYGNSTSEISFGGPNGCPASPCPSIPAWKQGHELFALVAAVLAMIPSGATQAAAAALNLVRDLGQFRLDVYLLGSVSRQDYVSLAISDLVSYVDVPDTIGTVWNFNLPVSVMYRARGGSTFWYPLGFRVTFDMLGIDPQPLTGSDPFTLPAGQAWSDWQEAVGTFTISGRVPVTPRENYPRALLLGRGQRFDGTAQSRRETPRPEARRDLRLRGPREIPRVVRKRVTMPFPRPTTRQGLPQGGQYTVILGTAPDATATRIVEILRTKGIEAFPVSVPEARDKVITLGSFASERDATLLANMLREVFRVETGVTARMDRKYYRVIGNDVISRLQGR